ncbi:OmpA family protein [Streptomyces sp. NPDC004609]|uniref:OmpA family protein n=1 Tax=Streptomyces sp. NPDC004609 TaxID=3364704 RepID=UPI003695943E
MGAAESAGRAGGVSGARPVRRSPGPRHPAAVTLAALVLVTGAQLTAAPGAAADETPGPPPGVEPASPPPRIDGDDPGLKMRDGATLAEPRVLDVVSIVETEGGEERRQETPTSLTFALQAEVLFGKNSAKLTPEAGGRVSAIVAEIKKSNAKRVRVFGFTDNLGTYEHGKVLSKQRADAVHGVLTQQLNDAGITYDVRGYSEDYPIADNATEEGRRKNRRVEVTFPTGGGGTA